MNTFDNRAYLYFSPGALDGRWTIALYSGDHFGHYPTKVKALIDARKYGLILSDSFTYRIFSDQGTQVFRSVSDFSRALRKLTNRDYFWGSFDTLVRVNARNYRASTQTQPTGWIETGFGTFSANGEMLQDTIGNGDFVKA